MSTGRYENTYMNIYIHVQSHGPKLISVSMVHVNQIKSHHT